MTAVLLALLLLSGASHDQQKVSEQQAIEQAKATVVRSVDGTLPNQRLDLWLRDLFGSTAKTAWEVNDCGEQTGDPQIDRGRDFPMCVEVSIPLENRRVLHLLFAVGTFKTGVHSQPPAFSHGAVLEAGTPVQWLKSLGEAKTVSKSFAKPL